MTPFLCLIVPIGGSEGHPSHPIAPGGPPPQVWPSPGVPTHPIYLPGEPPGIWPSPGVPTHPIYTPSPPVGIWPSPGHPAHPIAPGGPGGPPPGIWPSPGHPSHPIVIPPGSGVHPSHPIYVPAPTPPVGQEGYYLAYIPALGIWVYVPVGTTKPPGEPQPEPK
jgi:hypothetical protein